MEKLCILFCAHRRPIVFFCHTPGQLPPHDTGHGVKTVTLGGSEPLTSALRSEFMTQSLVLSIDGISPLETKHRPELFSSRSWPNIGPGFAFFGIFQKFGSFFFLNVPIGSVFYFLGGYL